MRSLVLYLRSASTAHADLKRETKSNEKPFIGLKPKLFDVSSKVRAGGAKRYRTMTTNMDKSTLTATMVLQFSSRTQQCSDMCFSYALAVLVL